MFERVPSFVSHGEDLLESRGTYRSWMQRVRTYLALVRVLLIADVVGSSCSWRTGPSNRSFGGDFMRLLSKMGVGLAACALVGFMPAKAEALVLSTANDACLAPGSSYSQDLQFLAGTPAPTNGCGLNTTGFTLLFKDDGSESGS